MKRRDALLLAGSAAVLAALALLLLLLTADGGDDLGSAVAREIGSARFWEDGRADFFGLLGEERRRVAAAGEATAARVLDARRAFEPRSRHCATECLCTRGGVVDYGRWCGYMYSGCEGLGACDALDECCRLHDFCVGAYSYANCTCTRALAAGAECAYNAADRAVGGCPRQKEAALRILADIKFLLPHCFG